jgi:protein SCO1/2
VRSPSQQQRIGLTVAVIVVFIGVVLVSFVHRVSQPRLMSASELKANGLYLMEPPRALSEFALTDHTGRPFTRESLRGEWSLLFFGFTHCPDICPTTLSFLNRFVGELEGTEAAATRVVMISVDPARDSVEQLAAYVPFFNPAFLGVTGEFLDLFRFATELNTPFRKVPGQGDDYQVDHSANVVLINPRGDYHGFFKAPLDLAKMKVTYRAARQLWER